MNIVQELLETKKKYDDYHNKISSKIQDTEKLLMNLKINIPFELIINEKINDTFLNSEKKFILRWDKYQKQNTFRLLYICKQEEINKPLIETKFDIRLKTINYLDLFLKNFIEHINKNIKDK